MLMLLSGATASAGAYDVGILVVPRQWNAVATLVGSGRPWAGDNGCFTGLDAGAVVRMLERFYPHRATCLFIVAPDVVADAAATLQIWPFWSRLIRGLGYPVAFVAQDGLTPDAVPWSELDALFIGGSTTFKESATAATLAAYAGTRGKHVHMGRVNSRRRLRIAHRIGCNSYDGTGYSIAPDARIPEALRWVSEIQQQAREQLDLDLLAELEAENVALRDNNASVKAMFDERAQRVAVLSAQVEELTQDFLARRAGE